MQILPTKLFIPTPQIKLVSRHGLLERLEAGLAARLTLVSAPAGYGKSTLLAAWLAQANLPAAWLSLDAGDNEPLRFWAYFAAALETIPCFAGSQLTTRLDELVRTRPEPDWESFLTALIAELTAQPERFVLILDDFHLVTEPDIQDGLLHLLESLPTGRPGLHLVLSSRADPPWPLARLRARGALNEFRVRDLRFKPAESAHFLNEVMGLGLAADEITALETRTEGWIAGLQMAALSMRQHADKTGFIQAFTGSHRFILDFLLEEVLDQQPPEIEAFLLKTSLVTRLNSALAEVLIADPQAGVSQPLPGRAQAMLEQLEQNNLFLMPLDDQRAWYRYHHLFADLLQKRLQLRYPALLPDLHRRASQWYAQAGYIPEAIEHACQTGDWDFAARQIETHVVALIQRGEVILTRQWLSQLPEDIIRPRPVLCIAQAWASARYGSIAFAEGFLDQAAAALEDDPALDAEVQGWISSQIAVLQVVIARARGDSTRRQQELALQALDRVDPVNDTAARATLLFRLGLCYLDLGKTEQADQVFRQAFDLGLSSGNHYAVHAANYGRMVLARLAGRLHDLAALIYQTLDQTKPVREPQQSLLGIDLIMSGSLDYEWNQLEQAETRLARGLELVGQVGIAELLIKGHFTFACLQLAQGNLSTVPDLTVFAERSNPRLNVYAAALQARLDLMLVQAQLAAQPASRLLRWAENQELSLGGLSSYDWDVQEKLVYARLLCWQAGQLAEEKATLAPVLDFINAQRQPLQELGWWGILIEVEVVIASMHQTLGETQAALDALGRALDLAKAEGFVRTFVDEGPGMRELLQLALPGSQHTAYIRKLLAAFAPIAAADTVVEATADAGHSGLVEALSEREAQVLRLLNTRLSVPEIAAELHLAPTTVRTHVRNIYSKLGVHGRIEALQKAQESGLL